MIVSEIDLLGTIAQIIIEINFEDIHIALSYLTRALDIVNKLKCFSSILTLI